MANPIVSASVAVRTPILVRLPREERGSQASALRAPRIGSSRSSGQTHQTNRPGVYGQRSTIRVYRARNADVTAARRQSTGAPAAARPRSATNAAQRSGAAETGATAY